MDLYEYDVGRGNASMIWKADGALELGAMSRDHRRFIVSEQHSDADNDLYLVERGAASKGTHS